jgi:NDP-sugar pyrophosphorylase family protein
MKVLFLCGGVGKRMAPLREDKLLLKFLGKSLLEHQLELARAAGLSRFVMVANPENVEKIERIVAACPGIEADIAIQQEPLGIGDAIERAEHLLDDEVLVVNPNDVFDGPAYARVMEASREGSAISGLLGYEVSEYFPGGYLVADREGNLEQIVEKPPKGEEPSNLVNILVHYHIDTGELLKYIKSVSTTKDDVYECAIDSMVKAGLGVRVVPYSGFWAAIKYPWHILGIIKYFLKRSESRIAPSARISPRSTIDGDVIIDENVRVLENAVIRGPAYIGANTIIGNNALVRDHSHIGADCVVGYCTEVKGSYIGDRCWFHSNYVGDSVIAEGCSFGAGTVLANFRFDEANISVRVGDQVVDTGLDKLGAIMGENSKTGINASILPGLKIGPNSFVGPHVFLTNDLQPNKMVLPEPRCRVLHREMDLDDKKKDELMKKLGGL